MVLLSLTAVCGFILDKPHYPFFQRDVVVRDQSDDIKDAFLKMIPPEASLVTTFEFMPRVSHRSELYSFHHIYWGHYTLSPKPYPLPERLDYALIDLNDGLTFGSFYSPKRFKNIQDFLLSSRLSPAAVRDNIVLFKTGVHAPVDLYSVRQSPPDKIAEDHLFSDDHLALNSIDTLRHATFVEVRLYWHALERSSRDVGQYFDFKDEEGRRVHRAFSPSCYRIYPSQAWKKGEWVVDHKYLTIPDELRTRPFSIEMGLYDVANYKPIGAKLQLFNVKGE